MASAIAAACQSLFANLPLPGTSNLRLYLQESTLPALDFGQELPQLPLVGHKSHANFLNVQDEQWRRLRIMERLLSNAFDDDSTEFVRRRIPSLNVGEEPDPVLGEELTVPCPTHFFVKRKVMCHALDIDRICRWVEQYPLATAQRAIHASFPETRRWSFRPCELSEPDSSLVRFFTWNAPKDDKCQSLTTMAVMVQCPWVASNAELATFARCRLLPHGPSEEERVQYRSQERMWAKMWDFCVRRKCHYFVITNYSAWVFGAFTAGRTRGFVSPVKKFDDRSPTVLEALTFWAASAMHLPGGNCLPVVPESVHDVAAEDTLMIPPAPSCRFPPPPPSESEWSEYGDDIDQDQAEANEVYNMLYVAPDGVQYAALAPPQPQQQVTPIERVIAWHDNLDDTMSEASSEAVTVSSAASTVGGATEKLERGASVLTWRTPNYLSPLRG